MAKILRGKEALEFMRKKKQEAAASAKLSPAKGRLNAKKAESKNKTTARGGRRAGTRDRIGVINFEAFDAAMRKFENSTIDWSIQFYRDWLSDVYATILGNTPVLTGRARANWQWGKTIAGTSVPGEAGRFPDPARGTLDRIAAEVNDLGPSFIFNNVVYIGDLDAGSSPQAPSGIVDISLAEVAGRMGGYQDALDAAVSLEDLNDGQRGSFF